MIDAVLLSRGLVLVGLAGLGVAAALIAPLVTRSAGLAERVAVLQLVAAKAVAACLAIAAAFDQPALIDAGLVLALLGAVGALVFAQGGAR